MSPVPARLHALSEGALRAVRDEGERADLRTVAAVVSAAVWERWLSARPPEDNRPEHEWVVFAAALAIAEDEGMTLSEKRVATAFAFAHDTYFIPRITETQIRRARADGLLGRAAELERAKGRQRQEHMERSAHSAREFLPGLEYPGRAGERLLTPGEVERCAGIIAGHDLWKLGVPHPPGADRLAVTCLEADALWPLHPVGVLADLERPVEGGLGDATGGPEAWRAEARNSLRTLIEYRANWADRPGETFADDESIFRTREGHRRYREWRAFWGV